MPGIISSCFDLLDRPEPGRFLSFQAGSLGSNLLRRRKQGSVYRAHFSRQIPFLACLTDHLGLSALQVMLIDPPGSSLFNKVKRGVLYTRHEAEGKRLRNPCDTITEGIGINRITANFSKAQVRRQ